jgi:hypothetical protein
MLNTRKVLLPLTVITLCPGPTMVTSWAMDRVAVVKLIVPVNPGWKSTVPPGGVVARASRSEPASWSLRLVTVLGRQRPSSDSM